MDKEFEKKLDEKLERLATKDDLERLARSSKDDLAKVRAEMATKDELERLVRSTKDDFASVRAEMATKDDLAGVRAEMATKDDLERLARSVAGTVEGLATKDDLAEVRDDLVELRAEMNGRFNTLQTQYDRILDEHLVFRADTEKLKAEVFGVEQ